MSIPQSSHTVFGLPRSHWHCHTDTFQWEGLTPASLQERFFKFLEDAVEGKPPHLLLTGAPGIGKSHLGVAAYRCMVQQVGTEQATWLNVPAFCDRVKASYGDDSDPMAEFERARRLVVLDDLFGRDLTSHEANQIIYRLLDTAYQNGAAVLLTMNQSVKEMASRLPPHEVSRVLAGATVIPVGAQKDWRLGG